MTFVAIGALRVNIKQHHIYIMWPMVIMKIWTFLVKCLNHVNVIKVLNILFLPFFSKEKCKRVKL